MEPQKHAYSKKEAAQHLGIGAMTLHRLTKNGIIRTVRVGSRVLVPRTELERFLAADPKKAA